MKNKSMKLYGVDFLRTIAAIKQLNLTKKTDKFKVHSMWNNKIKVEWHSTCVIAKKKHIQTENNKKKKNSKQTKHLFVEEIKLKI